MRCYGPATLGPLADIVDLDAAGAEAAMRGVVPAVDFESSLHAALAPTGVYAGTLTIGGLIARSDVHRAVLGRADLFNNVPASTIEPDDLAGVLGASTATDRIRKPS